MNNQQLIAYPQSTTLPVSFPSGEVVLDLFKDEPIPLVLNVDDFTNVAEADASYSKSFDIPGTKNNNIFFNNIFNVTASSDFDTHKKTKIIVKENTLNTFEGYMQLNDISIKDDIVTYNITIYSEAVNLKESIGNKVFRDLDLSELDNAFTSSNIENSWTGILDLFNPLPANSFAGSTGATTTSVLKYPMVNWANINMSSVGNITGGLANFFRPWVNALYLLQNIFRDAGYTFTSTFLNSTTFNKLFVDFNYGNSQAVADENIQADDITGTYGTSGAIVNATTVSGGNAALYDLVTDKITVNQNGSIVELFGNLYFISDIDDVEITLHHTNTSYPANVPSGYVLYSGQTYSIITPGFGDITLDSGEQCWLQIKGIGGSVSINTSTNNSWVTWNVSNDANTIINDTMIGFRGDTSQWEFFKGFIDMFKLVILVDENNPTNLLIEPYADWVGAGNELDWTNKIDKDEFLYTPIDGLARDISFNFTEDANAWETVALNHPNKWLWGYNFASGIEIIDKDNDEVEITPFSDTLVDELSTGNSAMPRIVDSSAINGGFPLNYWENNMRLLYDNGVHAFTGGTYNLGGFSNETDRLVFSAVNDYPITSTSKSLRFNTIAEPYDNNVLLNNLYNTYWAQYIDELYNKDTRIIKVEAFLTADDITKLNFNDTILIKSTRYRIYKIEYRAGAMSKLELITIRNL
tara:strand:+ start:1809 stop:3893 length:2085 start_codon:yes stop_codon:yes gene_type:complete